MKTLVLFFSTIFIFICLLLLTSCDTSGDGTVCDYAGKEYKTGASFKDSDGCNTCTCNSNGKVSCTFMECSVCDYFGTIYNTGEEFTANDDCNTCICNADGSVLCTEKYCITNPNSEIVTFIEANYSNCSNYIDYDNPKVCNGIIGFNCGQEVDGPYYFFNSSDFSVISICGGACMAPTGEQVEICKNLCPPPGWDCN